MYSISGLVTSSKYNGALPHCYLLSDFVLIPLDSCTEGFKGFPVEPFEELTQDIKQLAKELSYKGKVVFIEAEFFGGTGAQASMGWEKGRTIFGPCETQHNYEVDLSSAINEALDFLGVYAHGNNDLFDTLDLGRNRSNENWLEEISKSKAAGNSSTAVT